MLGSTGRSLCDKQDADGFCCCSGGAVGQVRLMGLAFGGKELVLEEDPNLNLRKVHSRLIKDKGLARAGEGQQLALLPAAPNGTLKQLCTAHQA